MFRRVVCPRPASVAIVAIVALLAQIACDTIFRLLLRVHQRQRSSDRV
jgi:hypothetical protein